MSNKPSFRKTNLSGRYAGESLHDEAAKRQAILGKDGLISFSGTDNFSTENESDLVYAITLHNDCTTSKRIALFPGDLANTTEISAVAGISCDAIAIEGNVITEGEGSSAKHLTCVADNIAYVQRFFKRNPTRIVSMQIAAESKIQLANKITFTQLSPFSKLGDHSFRPNEFRKAADNDTLMAEINCGNIQLDDQTLMDVVVAPGSGLSITMFLGAMRNDAKTLSQTAQVALG